MQSSTARRGRPVGGVINPLRRGAEDHECMQTLAAEDSNLEVAFPQPEFEGLRLNKGKESIQMDCKVPGFKDSGHRLFRDQDS
jgi:hypothetical protein